MFDIPSDPKKLISFTMDQIEACTVSQGMRAAYCRQVDAILESGKRDGGRSLLNLLPAHIDRLASHLYSPTDLKFTIDFENDYPANILKQGKTASRILTRDFERSNADMKFGLGVNEALKYGAAILKQWVQQEGQDKHPVYYTDLVMPWQFGVYREDINDITRQPVLCETSMLTLPEIWRRIWHLPNAEDLFRRIKGQSSVGSGGDLYNSFFHQVLSTSTLNTGNTGQQRPTPGGIVNLNNDPNYAIIGPQIQAPLVKFHELWVQGEDDYVTIQLVEPDIIVAPRFKKSNLLIPNEQNSGLQPYTVIQPNERHGYFWGVSELVQMIEPQGMLSVWLDDIQRLFGLQVDKILAFSGFDGLTDEVYGQFRQAGYINMEQGATVEDLTPKFPEQSLALVELMIKALNMIGGFDNVLSGQGEPGVRAGVHADVLLKTASPRLRDRSLLVERQAARAGDLRLSLMEAKDGRNYWTDGTDLKTIEATKFLLADLPEDRRVAVDSHSTSPIFADDHQQQIAFGLKAGFLNGHYAIDHLPLPDKEQAHEELKEKERAQAAQLAELKQKDPEEYGRVLEKAAGGGRKR